MHSPAALLCARLTCKAEALLLAWESPSWLREWQPALDLPAESWTCDPVVLEKQDARYTQLHHVETLSSDISSLLKWEDQSTDYHLSLPPPPPRMLSLNYI